MKHTKRLRVLMSGLTVGEIGTDQRGKLYFQYSAEWLKTGFDLSPETLEFTNQVQASKDPTLFAGLHGVFHDSLPDGWGLLLMDRALRDKMGWSPHEITPLDRLAYTGSRAMGALEYKPAIEPADESSSHINLMQLADSAERLLEGETPEILKQLQIQGGSPGGARPKVTVALSDDTDQCLSGFQELPSGFSHWLVKFRAQEDPKDMGRIEMAYAHMAKRAGIEMPECQLINVSHKHQTDEFFAVKRFDRSDNKRHHILSLSGYAYADHRIPSLSYETVINASRHITRNQKEAEKAFRLMTFNILAHNKDDHAKNFAFIYSEDEWRLSPAYDLTFSSGLNNQHTTDIAGSGNPDIKHIQQVAKVTGIDNWQQIIEEVKEATEQWNDIAATEGVSTSERNKISKSLTQIANRLKNH